MADTEIWLVKSSGRLLGPWNKSEIETALRSREIVPLDEIAPPFQRWRYIRDERAFDFAIAELRSKRGPSEQTQTNTSTETATDITERVYQFAPDEELTKGVKAQLKEAKPVIDPIRSEPIHVTSKVYEYEGRIKKTSPQYQYLIWGVLLLVVGVLTFQLVNKSNVQSPVLKSRTFDDALRSAQLFEQVGSSGDALNAYKEAVELKADSLEARLGLGMLLLHEGQTTESRSHLEFVMNSPLADIRKKTTAAVGMANAALLIDDYATAKRKIEEGLQINSTDPFLRIAQAHVLLNETKALEAGKLVRQTLDQGVVDPIAALLLAESDYLAARDGLMQDGYKSALAMLTTLADSSLGYRQEALILKLHILIESKQINDLDKVATDLLDADPRSSEDYLSDSRIYAGRAQWDHLLRYIKRSLGDVPSSPRLSAVLGYAMFKGREKLEGKRVVEDAFSKNPGDRLVRAVLSYVQSEIGRTEEAQAGLTISLEDRNLTLPLILKVRSCRENRDKTCLDENLKELLTRDTKGVVAISGMAWSAFEAGQLSEANRFLQQGLMISPRYQPLLRLKLKMEKKI
jgi:tetratricopeptide (TPR) repeat protein